MLTISKLLVTVGRKHTKDTNHQPERDVNDSKRSFKIKKEPRGYLRATKINQLMFTTKR